MAKLDTKTSEQKDHAEYSASGSERWLNCPGSHELAKKAPPVPESEYAAEGTEAHACFEFLLKNRKNFSAACVSAKKKWPDEIVKHCVGAVQYVLNRAVELNADTILSETKVDASTFTCPDQFGTLDFAIVQEGGRLVMGDFKYGAGIAVDVVDPNTQEVNSQLAYYALGVAELYAYNFDEVEMVVIQPRAFHHSGEVIRSVVITMDELMEWIPRFKAGVRATKSGIPVFATGKWCRFCGGATICPELKDKAFKDAQIAFSDEKGLVAMPAPVMIQLPNLGTILRACDKLENWISQVRAHAFHVLQSGGEVEGFKLVEKIGNREWVDEEKISKEAKQKFGAKVFSTPELLSPAQFEKATKGTPGADGWVEARTTRRVKGTAIAPENDKRPAVDNIKKIFGKAADA